MGFRGGNAFSGRIVLLWGACWAHCAPPMTTLGASLLLSVYNFSGFRRACFHKVRVLALFKISATNGKLCVETSSRHFPECPDPPILAFFDFLASFVFRFPLLFCAFFLSFPRILGVPRREKPLLFWGKTLAFSKKARVGGSGVSCNCFSRIFMPQSLHNVKFLAPIHLLFSKVADPSDTRREFLMALRKLLT